MSPNKNSDPTGRLEAGATRLPSGSRRRFLQLSAGIGLGALLHSRSRAADESASNHGILMRHERRGRALGTEVSLLVLHEDSEIARRALTAGMDEIERVESLLSIYRPESEISRLNRDGALESPNPTFVEILNISQEYSRRSGGAFDITVQPLWDLYARSIWKEKRIPSAQEIENARALVGYQNLEVSPLRLKLKRPGMGITLNGIAQGYATDRALAVLGAHGIRHALVDAGEIGAVGHKEVNGPWVAGIQHPRHADEVLAALNLDGHCVATSGDYATSFTPDRIYHHIFDPHSGLSPKEFSSVSVFCRRCVDADALTKVVFVSGLEAGRKFIQDTPDCEALFVLKDGTVLTTAEPSKFRR